MNIDVLCVGHASYDLVFSVDHHPTKNEKTVADSFIACGGGPAVNAAVMVAKLGLSAAFAGYWDSMCMVNCTLKSWSHTVLILNVWFVAIRLRPYPP